MDKLRCVVVDGDIGAGKSTFCLRLGACPAVVEAVLGKGRKLVTVVECLAEWQGMGLFGLMCESPNEWSNPFQHVAMVSRVSRWSAVAKEHANDPTVCLLLERSPQADRFVFTHVLTQRKSITTKQAADHGKWYDYMWDKRPHDIQRVGVLTCDFDVIKQRIEDRERAEEKKYDKEYLRQLHERYQSVITTDEWPLRDVTVALDATRNFKDCDRALYTEFAKLCGVEPTAGVASQFTCECLGCE